MLIFHFFRKTIFLKFFMTIINKYAKIVRVYFSCFQKLSIKSIILGQFLLNKYEY